MAMIMVHEGVACKQNVRCSPFPSFPEYPSPEEKRAMSDSRFPSSYMSGQFRFVLVAASGLLTAMNAPADDKAVQRELESLKGVWSAVHVRSFDKAIPKEELDRQEVTWTFKDGAK